MVLCNKELYGQFVESNKEDEYLKKYIFNRSWLVFFSMLLLLLIIGIIWFIRYPTARYDFIYENLIWFPLEIAVTTLVINKILSSLDKRKEKDRFIKVTKRPTETLILSLKENIVDIVFDRNTYSEKRPSTDELYKEIINDIDSKVDDNLTATTRSIRLNSTSLSLNIYGILTVACDQLNTDLKKYIDRFHIFFDDDIYLAVTYLEKRNFSLGLLRDPFALEKGNSDKYVISGNQDDLRKEIQEHIKRIDSLIALLNKKISNT